MKFSLINRRIHMYLGLALAPWMLMYAVSSIMLNHRDFFDAPYRNTSPWLKDSEEKYQGNFSPDAKPKSIAAQILAHLDLKGPHNVRHNIDNKTLMIHRSSFITPRRITYNLANKKLLVERHKFRFSLILRRLHFRRGYQQKYILSDLWALSVDIVILAMFLWIVSGLYMWYTIKTTRRWGIICITAGMAIFIILICIL